MTEHCWHTIDWGERCCYCGAERGIILERVGPEGHGRWHPINIQKPTGKLWFIPKEPLEAQVTEVACLPR